METRIRNKSWEICCQRGRRNGPVARGCKGPGETFVVGIEDQKYCCGFCLTQKTERDEMGEREKGAGVGKARYSWKSRCPRGSVRLSTVSFMGWMAPGRKAPAWWKGQGLVSPAPSSSVHSGPHFSLVCEMGLATAPEAPVNSVHGMGRGRAEARQMPGSGDSWSSQCGLL